MIYSYLKKQNITKLDYVIVTHHHEDRIGGFSSALVNFDIREVFSPALQADSDVYKDDGGSYKKWIFCLWKLSAIVRKIY